MSVEHDTFTIDRTFTASRSRLFTAFADPAAKEKWFGPRDHPHAMDFRVGGTESLTFNGGVGPAYTFDAHYLDIVPDERIVYSYDMTMDGRRISVSVATLEFPETTEGSRLILTELGAFLDDLDTNAIREGGTKELMESLERSLEE